jgi:GxxExxY protein
MNDLYDITYNIRKAIFEVHNVLGPGLLESVYTSALKYELAILKLKADEQIGVPVNYKIINLELGFRIDLLVENKVIIEIKSVEKLHPVHMKQLLTYLKLSNLKLGILVNFNVYRLVDKESLIRIIN